MKHKRTVAALLLIIASGSVWASTPILAPEKNGVRNKIYTQNYPQIKVATFNIAANRVANDLSKIAEVIQNIDADIISINEVDKKTERSLNTDQMQEIAKIAGMHYYFAKAIDYQGGEYGIAVLSKHPIKKTQQFNLPSGETEQRVLLISQIDVPGFDSPILFLNTHLDWSKDPTIRIEQVRKILDYSIGDIASDFTDIASNIKILAGDFNEPVDGIAVTELRQYWNIVAQNNIDNRTWPADNPALDLDHIFTFKGQKWDIKKLTIPSGDKPSGINWPAVSDHLPVIAELRLLEQ